MGISTMQMNQTTNNNKSPFKQRGASSKKKTEQEDESRNIDEKDSLNVKFAKESKELMDITNSGLLSKGSVGSFKKDDGTLTTAGVAP